MSLFNWRILEEKERLNIMNDVELTKRIIDCISDGYDDEENRSETETELYEALSRLDNGNIIKSAFMSLCERVEELER